MSSPWIIPGECKDKKIGNGEKLLDSLGIPGNQSIRPGSIYEMKFTKELDRKKSLYHMSVRILTPFVLPELILDDLFGIGTVADLAELFSKQPIDQS